MNNKQSNKLAMYRTVQALLNSTTATSGLSALPAKVAALGNKIKAILELANVQTLPTEGATGERAALLAAAIRASLAVAGPVLSYARSRGLGQLAALVDVARSDFKEIRLGERPRLAQRILDAAQPLVEEAGPYGLTPALVADLAAKIAAAGAVAGGPVPVAADKHAATVGIATAFAEADALLAEIDPMMEPFRAGDPEFFGRYEYARRIEDRPGVRSGGDPAAAAVAKPAAVAAASETVALPKAA